MLSDWYIMDESNAEDRTGVNGPTKSMEINALNPLRKSEVVPFRVELARLLGRVRVRAEAVGGAGDSGTVSVPYNPGAVLEPRHQLSCTIEWINSLT
jgi:hypothetical protein